MDENIFYFDVFHPLNRMKEDILELKNYGYDFNKHYDEIVDILRERETLEKTDTDSETNSEIIEKLDKIEEEISQLLNENFSETTDFEYEESDLVFEDEYLEESDLEEEIKQEKDLEENLRIEEEIKQEKQREEKEAEEYLENEEREIEEAITRYVERNIENDFRYKHRAIDERKYTERDLKFMMDMYDLNRRIDDLKNGIDEYKKDFAIFYEDLQNLKRKIIELNKNI